MIHMRHELVLIFFPNLPLDTTSIIKSFTFSDCFIFGVMEFIQNLKPIPLTLGAWQENTLHC